MKKSERFQKIGYISLIALFFIIGAAGIGFSIWAFYMSTELEIDITFLLAVLVAISVGSILVGLFCISVCKAVFKKYKTLYANVPVIEENYKRVRQELENMGFNSEQHISAFGYENMEYRDDFGVPDNCHIDIDKTNRKIALCKLLPFDFRIIDFSDVAAVDMKILINSALTFVCDGIDVTFRLKDGTSFVLGVGDGTHPTSSRQFTNSLENARKLVSLLRMILVVGGVDE